jgi:hypothetical protein
MCGGRNTATRRVALARRFSTARGPAHGVFRPGDDPLETRFLGRETRFRRGWRALAGAKMLARREATGVPLIWKYSVRDELHAMHVAWARRSRAVDRLGRVLVHAKLATADRAPRRPGRQMCPSGAGLLGEPGALRDRAAASLLLQGSNRSHRSQPAHSPENKVDVRDRFGSATDRRSIASIAGPSVAPPS